MRLSLPVCLLLSVVLPLLGGGRTLLHAQPSPTLTPRAPLEIQVSELGAGTGRLGHYAQRSPDRWLARDKLTHLTLSFLWTLSAQYVLVEKADWSRRAALPVSAASGAAIGLAKELFDWRVGPHRRFSIRDLVADAAGILLAVGVILL